MSVFLEELAELGVDVRKYNHGHGSDGRFSSRGGNAAVSGSSHTKDELDRMRSRGILSYSSLASAKSGAVSRVNTTQKGVDVYRDKGGSMHYTVQGKSAKQTMTDNGHSYVGTVHADGVFAGEKGRGIVKSISSEYNIAKRDDDKMQVFGWGLVSHEWSEDSEGQPVLKQLIDYQKDMLDQDEMEKIAYNFVMKYRDGGDMHETAGEATCIESVCLTVEKQQAMGIPAGVVPVGWWLGFQIHNDGLWDKVKKGERRAFSIEGKAGRQPVEIDTEEMDKYSPAK